MFLMLLSLPLSCKDGDKSPIETSFSSNLYINVAHLDKDIEYFISRFEKHKLRFNTVSWSAKSNFDLTSIKSEQMTSLIFAKNKELSKDTLLSNLPEIYYYLDRIWIDKKFNSAPIPKDVLALIGDFIRGDFKLNQPGGMGTLLGVRTFSSMLRLIGEIDDLSQLPPELTRKFGNMPLDKIKSILTKTAYDAVRDRFYELQKFDDEKYYPVFECRKYWAIAPIMNLDEGYKEDIVRLKGVATEVHALLDTPEKSLYGSLKDHLICVETIEESIGKSPDSNTGYGIFDRYIKFIANNLWDYPFYGKQCGPFRGVMGNFSRQNDSGINYCKDNFKSVGDNMYLRYLLNRFGARDDLLRDPSALLKEGLDMSKIGEAESQTEKRFTSP